MKKVNWLLEKDIYDRESEFLAELQKQGYIFGPFALEPFRERAYNLTIAKLTPDSSMNIKSLKQTSRIFFQNSYRRLRTL